MERRLEEEAMLKAAEESWAVEQKRREYASKKIRALGTIRLARQDAKEPGPSWTPEWFRTEFDVWRAPGLELELIYRKGDGTNPLVAVEPSRIHVLAPDELSIGAFLSMCARKWPRGGYELLANREIKEQMSRVNKKYNINSLIELLLKPVEPEPAPKPKPKPEPESEGPKPRGMRM